eukprot:TRINITY_DN6279_c0_g1_i1.p1 TRINITY_DN6279_c0_g1~~TRINITY_DN6279_c0_g1_i1.p1  ORF type:complete len:508 (-),score=133.49 TRINITY_DN6279_c0_g1_i1:1173-2696(-)
MSAVVVQPFVENSKPLTICGLLNDKLTLVDVINSKKLAEFETNFDHMVTLKDHIICVVKNVHHFFPIDQMVQNHVLNMTFSVTSSEKVAFTDSSSNRLILYGNAGLLRIWKNLTEEIHDTKLDYIDDVWALRRDVVVFGFLKNAPTLKLYTFGDFANGMTISLTPDVNRRMFVNNSRVVVWQQERGTQNPIDSLLVDLTQGPTRIWREQYLPFEVDTRDPLVLLAPSKSLGHEVIIHQTKSGVTIMDHLRPPDQKRWQNMVSTMKNSKEVTAFEPLKQFLMLNFPQLSLYLIDADQNTIAHVLTQQAKVDWINELFNISEKLHFSLPFVVNKYGEELLDISLNKYHRDLIVTMIEYQLRCPAHLRYPLAACFEPLAKTYPDLLSSMLSRLPLEKVHPLVDRSIERFPLEDENIQVLGSLSRSPLRLWERHAASHIVDERSALVTPLSVPIPYLVGRTMSVKGSLKQMPLHVIVEHEVRDALKNDTMRAVIQFKWETYAKFIFIKNSR